MSDMEMTWNKFFQARSETLWKRFPGQYRALVVETNDPLCMFRIRVKCPDLHDFDLNDSDCPWASPAFDMGSKREGRWSHPYIGDWVWVAFERNHPYGIIWTGFATPTRRKYYPLASIFQPTPIALTSNGAIAGPANDYNNEYLPKDGRPMSHGWSDRYGNLDIHNSVGFYPLEHAAQPPPPDFDAIQNAAFQQRQNPPQVNAPDTKYMLRHTKYGSGFILSDQGYWWKKQGDDGEFSGDVAQDEAFEIERWKYIQQLVNEG